ncbi:sugar ABC transporter ATP-binding protein [Facklamia sp. DSM 111018]|uniref:Sugar ABC transporter ATP-binding protein n=2 Tax=Facklamia lactis TaxID=2749967 RepID=A0ABS0LQC9_9LACT|nr:sugar ABC transporter ATP-binding protein [Facklamia lactis]
MMGELKDNILVMDSITKEFPGIKALDNVSFSVREGEVHALCGENGAGKSTLMKILSGAQKQSSGTIFINGVECEFDSTVDAVSKGISMVYQEFNLVNELTIAENIFIGRLPQKGFIIDWNQLFMDAEAILNKLSFDIDPHKVVSEISVAEAQMVEIAKSLSLNSKVIVLDEPTAALTEEEISTLFTMIKELRSKGIAVIYISHRMDEIFEISDRITVLRNGQYVDTKETKGTDYDEIVAMMIGRYVDSLFPVRKPKTADYIFEVNNLSGKIVDNISFKLKGGEILGVVGLLGSGNYELTKLIYGSSNKKIGEMILNGERININSPYDAIKNGIGLVPEDRKRDGLVLDATVNNNIVLSSLDKISNKKLLNFGKEQRVVDDLIKKLNIKVSDPNKQIVNNLSGGNQQKVLFAKVFNNTPKVFMFNEPTRGVDVGAKAEIYRIIDILTDSGVSVIIVSSDLEEVIGMCDRIIVLKDGKLVLEKEKDNTTQEELLAYASGGVK